MDKRTKEYKQWVKTQKGLGDIVEDFTEATGIKSIVKKVFGDDCGCNERKAKLNKIKIISKKKAVRCLTEDMYNEYNEYRKRRTLQYLYEDVTMLIRLYAHVFAIQYDQKRLCVGCSGTYKIVKQMEDLLDKVYESYSS